MQIQLDSPYVHDENPAALLAGAEIEAAGLHRCLKIVRLWSQSSACLGHAVKKSSRKSRG
jgi:hypothetical protein